MDTRNKRATIIACIIVSLIAILLGRAVHTFIPETVVWVLCFSGATALIVNAVIFDILRRSIIRGKGLGPLVQAVKETWYTSLAFAFLFFGTIVKPGSDSLNWAMWAWVPVVASIPIGFVVYETVSDSFVEYRSDSHEQDWAETRH